MKVLYSIGISLLTILASCHNCHNTESNQTMSDTFKYYSISFDELINFSNIIVNIPQPNDREVNKAELAYFSYFLVGLDEESLGGNKDSIEVLRVLSLKAKKNPLLIKIQKSNSGICSLLMKSTDGGFEFIGKSTQYLEKRISQKQFENIKSIFIRDSLYSMVPNPEYNFVSSGHSLLMETVFDGRYNCIVRDAPELNVRIQDDSLQIKSFLKIFEALQDLCTIDM